MVLLVLASCDKVDIQVETGKPYVGLYQGKDCLVVFDQADECNIKGRAYLDEGGLTAAPVAFNSDMGSNGSGHVWVGDKQMDLKLLAEDSVLRCELRSDAGTTAFSLQQQTEETFPFKAMYMEPVYEAAVEPGRVYAHNVPGYWSSYPDTKEDFGTIYSNKVKYLLDTQKLNLDMDLYYPREPVKHGRPLLLLIHGGAFYNGDKQAVGFPEMGRHFAERGYVVASINYRMGFKPMSADVDRAGYRALQDAHAAVCYLIENAEEFGIDTTMIFAAGTSAGAITALNLAFMREENRPITTRKGGVEDWSSSRVKRAYNAINWVGEKFGLEVNTDRQDFFESLGLGSDLGGIDTVSGAIDRPFHVNAVVNMWGAVHDLNMLKNSKSTAILSFHSDADHIVPYAYGYPFDKVLEPYEQSIMESLPEALKPVADWSRSQSLDGKPINEWAFNPIYGSSTINDKATALGLRSELHTCSGCGHSLHVNEDGTLSDYFYETILPTMTRFLCKELMGSEIVELVRTQSDGQWFEAVGTDNVSELHWQVEGGVVIGGGDNKVKVMLFADAPKRAVSVCGKYKNGVEFRETWKDEE